jgi:hypothetical protein
MATDPTQSTALVPTDPPLPAARTIRAGTPVAAFVPGSFDEAMKIARVVSQSGMAPKSYQDNEAKILVGFMIGAELGLTPMQSLRGIAMIGNNPNVWGDVALGLVMGSGLVEDMSEVQEGDFDNINNGDGVAVCTIKRRGRPTPVCVEFGMQDARRAGLLTKAGPWRDGYRPRMCQMRARAFAMRDLFADVLSGLGVAMPDEFAADTTPQSRTRAIEAVPVATVDELAAQANEEHPAAEPVKDTPEPTAEAAPEPKAEPAKVEPKPRKPRVRTPAVEEKPKAPTEPAGPLQHEQREDLRTKLDDAEEAEKRAHATRDEQSADHWNKTAKDLRADLAQLESEFVFAAPAPDAPNEYESRQNPDDNDVFTRDGYDLNKHDPETGEIPRTVSLYELAIIELGKKELVADVANYQPPEGLTANELFDFEAHRGQLVQRKREEARARR